MALWLTDVAVWRCSRWVDTTDSELTCIIHQPKLLIYLYDWILLQCRTLWRHKKHLRNAFVCVHSNNTVTTFKICIKTYLFIPAYPINQWFYQTQNILYWQVLLIKCDGCDYEFLSKFYPMCFIHCSVLLSTVETQEAFAKCVCVHSNNTVTTFKICIKTYLFFQFIQSMILSDSKYLVLTGFIDQMWWLWLWVFIQIFILCVLFIVQCF